MLTRVTISEGQTGKQVADVTVDGAALIRVEAAESPAVLAPETTE